MRYRLNWLFLPLLCLNLTSTACGPSGHKKKATRPPLGPAAAAFAQASQQHHIPQEILMAVAYKESGIDAHPAQTGYGPDEHALGPQLAQTAIGLSRPTLGLTDASPNDLTTQLDAYGAWVQKNLETLHLSLPAAITKNDDIYDWVWQLARMHHGGSQSSKNVQIIFALEVLNVLNKGFIWQDPSTKEHLELRARTPALDRTSFSPPIQANLKLDTRTSELFFVDYLQLMYGSPLGQENQPKRILVVHCPFSLSTCIGDQLQTAGDTPRVPLEAHYVIPADTEILANPIKILQHKTPVRSMDSEGQVHVLTDTLVIMLTGNSGRAYDGQRFALNPSWYTRNQLKNLGKTVLGICELLQRENSGFDASTCRTPELGIQFKRSSRAGLYQFGDVPDFDSKIFWSFIQNPDELSGEITIQLPQDQKIYPAGSRIQPTLNFIKGTAKLEIQLLERCTSGKPVWTGIQTHFIRNTDSKMIDLTLYDQGPNGNGQQFIRALAYDNQGKLMGWATQDFYLSAYDSEGNPLPDGESCRF